MDPNVDEGKKSVGPNYFQNIQDDDADKAQTHELLSPTAELHISPHDVVSEPVNSLITIPHGAEYQFVCQPHRFVQRHSDQLLDISLRSKLAQVGMNIRSIERIEDKNGERLVVTIQNLSDAPVSLQPGKPLKLGTPYYISKGVPLQGTALQTQLLALNEGSDCGWDPFQQALYVPSRHDQTTHHTPVLPGIGVTHPRYDLLDHDAIYLPVASLFDTPIQPHVDLYDLPAGTNRRELHQRLGWKAHNLDKFDKNPNLRKSVLISQSFRIRVPYGLVLVIQAGVRSDNHHSNNVSLLDHVNSRVLRSKSFSTGEQSHYELIFETLEQYPQGILCYVYPVVVED